MARGGRGVGGDGLAFFSARGVGIVGQAQSWCLVLRSRRNACVRPFFLPQSTDGAPDPAAGNSKTDKKENFLKPVVPKKLLLLLLLLLLLCIGHWVLQPGAFSARSKLSSNPGVGGVRESTQGRLLACPRSPPNHCLPPHPRLPSTGRMMFVVSKHKSGERGAGERKLNPSEESEVERARWRERGGERERSLSEARAKRNESFPKRRRARERGAESDERSLSEAERAE